MKLRFRDNSLRLRVNQREVTSLAAGNALEGTVRFPNDSRFIYTLEPNAKIEPEASFDGGRIRITAPLREVKAWAHGESLGLYFDLPADDATTLRVAIEKDLECVDTAAEERDPDAFPRSGTKC
ncbi:MAG TPA: hypothetical protein VHZ55_03400 [Bryobacteraceae bacterium]|jgi:hypothetical protein|nr:hypothetical protein [Bryobacteraceae bacterium]